MHPRCPVGPSGSRWPLWLVAAAAGALALRRVMQLKPRGCSKNNARKEKVVVPHGSSRKDARRQRSPRRIMQLGGRVKSTFAAGLTLAASKQRSCGRFVLSGTGLHKTVEALTVVDSERLVEERPILSVGALGLNRPLCCLRRGPAARPQF